MAMEQTAFANPVIGTKRARAGEFRQHVEPADAGQQAGQKDQRDRRQRRRDTLLRAETGVQVGERLSQRADQTADEKGFDRIEQTTALFASLRNIVEIVFFIHKIPQPHI